MLDNEKAADVTAKLSEIVDGFRGIKETQGVSAEGQKRLEADLSAATAKYDEAIAAQKASVAIAEQEAKEAIDRATDLEAQFALLKDAGKTDIVSKDDEKGLMNALLRGKEHLKTYLDSEDGIKAYDKYIAAIATTNTAGVDVPQFSGLKAEAERIHRKAAETPSLRTDINIQGGVLLSPEWARDFIQKALEITPIEQYANVVTIGGKSIQQPVFEQMPKATFQGELVSATNSIPKFSMTEFAPKRQSIVVPTSMEMLTQSDYDIVSFINGEAAKAMARGLGERSVDGNGVGMPEGFMTNADVAGDDLAFSADAILGMIYKMPSMYNLAFYMSRLTLGKIRLLQDDYGRYIWSAGGSLSDGNQPNIGGIPYVDTFIDMDSTLVDDNKPILLADMKEFYQITKNNNVYVVRDDYSNSREAQVNFVFHRWITGNVRNPEAGRYLQVVV